MENRLADLLTRPANRTCIDCGAAHPQWASLNNGVFFCLECSGIHRSLGVQTSFVRSVTMDHWTSDQVAKMESAGNDRALEFWKSRPDWREGMPIKEKYNSDFARKYRERLNGPSSGSNNLPPQAPSGVKQVYSSHTNTVTATENAHTGDWFAKIKQQVSSTFIEPVKHYVASNSTTTATTTGQRKPKSTPSPAEKKPQDDDAWSW